MNAKWIAAWGLAGMAVLVSGCQEPKPSTDEAIEAAIKKSSIPEPQTASPAPAQTQTAQSIPGGGGKVQREDTSQVFTGAEARIPEGFPPDVPQYAYQRLLMTSIDPPYEMFMIQATSTESAEAVKSWYAKEIAAAGWVEQTGGMSGMSLLGGSMRYKKNDRVLSVRVSNETIGSMILLSTSKKAKP